MGKQRSRIGRIPKIDPKVQASPRLTKEKRKLLLGVEKYWKVNGRLPRGVNPNEIAWFCSTCHKLTKHLGTCAMSKRDAAVAQTTLNGSAASTPDASESRYNQMEQDAMDALEMIAAESLPGGDVNANINANCDTDVVDIHNGDDVSDDEEEDEEDGDDINYFGRRGGIQQHGRASVPTAPTPPATALPPTTSAVPATQGMTIAAAVPPPTPPTQTPACRAAANHVPSTQAAPVSVAASSATRKPNTVRAALPLLFKLAQTKFRVPTCDVAGIATTKKTNTHTHVLPHPAVDSAATPEVFMHKHCKVVNVDVGGTNPDLLGDVSKFYLPCCNLLNTDTGSGCW